MKVLLLGATGYVGSTAATHLASAGHEVVALTRAADARPGAFEQRTGDLTDPASLSRAVTDDIEAVVNIATPTGDEAVDTAALDALLNPLRGTRRAFVYTSGVWVLGETGDRAADEASPTNAIDIVGYRPRIEERVLAAAKDEVRGMVVRPGIVYGNGGGIPGMMVTWAKEHGRGRYVGTAATRWPMVHVADLAALYGRALERGTAGGLLHGVALDAVPTAALAAAADVAAGGPGRAEPWPAGQAAESLGAPFAEALALDQVVSGRHTAGILGWQPTGPWPTTDLISGSYG
jgi:nucleoside-diphosphate-sugar epimerase